MIYISNEASLSKTQTLKQMLKLPGYRTMIVTLLSLGDPSTLWVLLAQRFSYNKMDTIESAAQNLQKY